MEKPRRKVLILGGGFAGIKAALELVSDVDFDVTLISDQPNFRYYPTLFHAATGGKMAASSIPLAEIFEGKPVKIIQDTAKTIDRPVQKVRCVSGKSFDYETLIVALGVVTNFFGIKGLEQYAYGIKTQEEAQRLRDHIHKQLVDEK